jgi:phage tail protein X
MNRYNLTPQGKASGSLNLVYKSTYYPVIPKSGTDRYIFSIPGDRLDNLAFTYYGNTSYWFILALANDLSTGTLVVPEKTQLRIPDKIILNSLPGLMQNSQTEL